MDFDLFSFEDSKSFQQKDLKKSNIKVKKLKIIHIKTIRIYNPFLILFNYKNIILCGEGAIISNWFILLISKLINKRVFIWGHGVSYGKKNKISFYHYLMNSLAYGIIFYTPKEMRFWRRKFPEKKMTALNNTQFVDQTYLLKLNEDKINNRKLLKAKYNVQQKKVLISSYRFTNRNRRLDLLLKVIKESNPEMAAFIIIGDGYLKPDFSNYKNVFDFGALWDTKIKTELFFISDFYIQFGAIGLSIVEAMAYGKPIVTMRRDEGTKQGVEYFYLKNNFNSLILSDINEFETIYNMNKIEIERLSENSFETYSKDLQINNMVDNFLKILTNENSYCS